MRARLPVSILLALIVLATAGPSGGGVAERALAAARRTTGPAYFIVQLTDAPLARYRGGVESLEPTSPQATGAPRLDAASPASVRYLAHLDRAQAEAIRSIESASGRPVEVLHRYRHAFNGVAVWLTPEEAEGVAGLDGVVHVERVTVDEVATDVGPGLIGAPGIWDGSATGGLPGTMGEGVVIGIIDTGINIDHPSFAALGGDGYRHTNPLGAGNYLGWCDPAHPEHDARFACNDKLIGLWSFPDASMNPEDENGHGSHTSSTSAGNVQPLTVPTIVMTRTLSGVAPHANVVMYDACAGSGCAYTATVAAIDQATADGVDVINYSISIGTNSPWLNSRLVAFYGAYEAGIFVAASAGNAGPSTVDANAPWITTVAATTHGRSFGNALVGLTGGDGEPPADIEGSGLTAAYGPAPIVHAAGHQKADGTPDDGQCLEPFPAGTWSGEIVVCDRGQIARVGKGANVLAGGAGGFVLANTEANLPGDGIADDPHFIPGVHIRHRDAEPLRAWLASGTGHSAAIGGVVVSVEPAASDNLAGFSSTGPAQTGLCCRRPGLDVDRELFDVLKPDVAAPGVNIMAAIASGEPNVAPEYGMLSGTSMASPHVAGAAALLRALHGDWSPAQVQSALMLTAGTNGVRKSDGSTVADWFDVGAGRVDLAAAARSGLVLDVTAAEFASANPDTGGQPSDLNLPSMADAWCFGDCAWTRSLQGVADEPVTWSVTVAPAPGQEALPDGLVLGVEPASFTVAPGAMAGITVTADVAGLDVGNWALAQVVLTPDASGVPEAHMPVAVRRVDRRLPPVAVIFAERERGRHDVPGLQAPAIADLDLAVVGLSAGQVTVRELEGDPTTGSAYDDPAGTFFVTVDVPDGARRLVAEVAATTSPDLDLFVGRDVNGDGQPQSGEQVCTSGGSASDEYCDVIDPEPGSFWVLVQNFRASGDAPDPVTLVTGMVPGADAGNLAASGPGEVPAAEPFGLMLEWDLPGLVDGDRWFGVLDVRPDGPGSEVLDTIAIDLVGAVPERRPVYLPALHWGEDAGPG